VKGELIRVWTDDELQLQGLYCAAPSSRLPAVVHIHGASSNFYRSQFLDSLADELVARGYPFLSANTRGHDIINNVYSRDPMASRRIGVAFELFEDCLLDLKAWLEFAQTAGHELAVLLGHSFGALKVAYYQGEAADDRVRALIFVSPADQGFWLGAMGGETEKGLAWARKMVDQGEGEALLSGPLLPYPMSAGTVSSLFLSGKSDIFKFGRPEEPWGTVAKLSVPILAVMGTVGEFTAPDPEGAMALLGSKALSSPRCDTVVIQGAPHNYRGYETQVTDAILGWLDDVFGNNHRS
jgi:pimeloyl-ACP methyl ester carboxylesterase